MGCRQNALGLNKHLAAGDFEYECLRPGLTRTGKCPRMSNSTSIRQAYIHGSKKQGHTGDTGRRIGAAGLEMGGCRWGCLPALLLDTVGGTFCEPLRDLLLSSLAADVAAVRPLRWPSGATWSTAFSKVFTWQKYVKCAYRWLRSCCIFAGGRLDGGPR